MISLNSFNNSMRKEIPCPDLLMKKLRLRKMKRFDLGLSSSCLSGQPAQFGAFAIIQ